MGCTKRQHLPLMKICNYILFSIKKSSSPSPKMDLRSLILIFFIVGIPNCMCQNEYEICKQPFECGSLRNLSYPFYGGTSRPYFCGYPGFELVCEGDDAPLLNASSLPLRVLAYDNARRTLRVAREDLWSNICTTPSQLNMSLDPSLFNLYAPANDQTLTLLYGCTGQLPQASSSSVTQFDCNGSSNGGSSLFVTRGGLLPEYNMTCAAEISVVVNQTAALELENGNNTRQGISVVQSSLRSGFSIQWAADDEKCGRCAASGGSCGSDRTPVPFVCYCAAGSFQSTCPTNGSKNGLSDSQKYALMGASLFLVGLGIAFIICRYVKPRVLAYVEKISHPSVEQFLLSNTSLALKRYSFYEIDKITRSFKDKLGQGGFGIVYKGEMSDGQLVAVKVLSQTHDEGNNAEEFINEVASISRTSHVNIVNLLGFCYGRRKRALVYEYMPNKSLDKFIYTRKSDNAECSLGLEKLYGIALGVARGLEYLHRGCTTRIVHFDIKPQNILLDEDFSPKISDFGLAKLYKKKQSMISMLGMRGTIGYIAPEVFSRNFGVVSDKSDVYSYGMMLLEMGEVRKMVGIEAALNHSSESYFPDNIYEQVFVKNNKVDDVVRDDKEESEIKMVMVGLWCIQTVPTDRPSMSKVLEMLEGSLKSIPIPPRPFFPALSESEKFSSFVNKDYSGNST